MTLCCTRWDCGCLELDEMIQQFINEENVDTPDDIGSYTYEDILNVTFKVINSADLLSV